MATDCKLTANRVVYFAFGFVFGFGVAAIWFNYLVWK